MRYTENDIPKIPLREFMAALGEKPVKSTEHSNVYYPPYRDDSKPVFVVYHTTNQWHDYGSDEKGSIIDLAMLKMNPMLDKDPKAFIVRRMNDYEIGKEMQERSHRPVEPIIIKLDIKNVRLTDFMKAIGYEHPVSTDGNLLTYNAPYDSKHEPTMVINTDTNLWRDTKSGAYGGIYDLAYELTGSCNMHELNMYISGQMSNIRQVSIRQLPQEQPKEDAKPKRKMRL